MIGKLILFFPSSQGGEIKRGWVSNYLKWIEQLNLLLMEKYLIFP